MSTENPFQPPQATDLYVEHPARRRAKVAWLIINLMLIVPATYNALEFSALKMGTRLTPREALFVWGGNLVLIVIGGFLCWLLGLRIIERMSLFIRSLLAGKADKSDWQEILYLGIYRAAILSIPGAILWMVWGFAFYRMQIDFFVISWVIGVPAHLLGAAVYLPIVYGWYRLRGR